MTVPSLMERHIQTGIQIVLVALLIWFGQSIIELKDKMARVETQLLSIQTAQAASVADRYPRTQASIEIGQLRREIDSLEQEARKEHTILREWNQSLRDRIIDLESFARQKGFVRKQDGK